MHRIYLMDWAETWGNTAKAIIRENTEQAVQFVSEKIHEPRTESSEMFNWFIWKVQTCDVVILNFDKMDYEAELKLMAINTINAISSNKIFVVGFGTDTKLKPFVKDAMFHTEQTVEDAVEYINTYLMV